MGCASTRTGSINSQLKDECDKIMVKNIELLKILEYLFIQNKNLSAALKTLYLIKCVEQYYRIVMNYRNFWLSEAKSSIYESTSAEKFEKCEKEQTKEKDQLIECHRVLLSIISSVSPNWSDEYKSIKEYLETLETSSIVTQTSTTLYGNFYLATKQEIKEGMREFGEVLEADKEVFKAIRKVAVHPYKDQKKCVYFTDKIVISPKKQKDRLNTSRSFMRELLSPQNRKEILTPKENLKNEEQGISERLTKNDSEVNTKIEFQQFDEVENEESESYSESEMDEEYLARLSVSQK